MNNQATAVIYGKHRGFGDFVNLGLSLQARAPLDRWLDHVLPELRQRWGPDWEVVWAAARPLHFWIGPSLLGVPLTGIFMTSADRVGRQFPLLFGLAGVLSPPPVDPEFDPTPYAALWSHIADVQMPQAGHRDGRMLLSGFELPQITGGAWTGDSDGTLWAQRRDGDLNRLLADARHPDAAQAQFSRSHWWRQPIEAADTGWLACNGLPDASALEWLLTE
ncbi:MAG: type VI secretion system-associated protein TagF [Rhodobacteraceae bacterium]|nr:type VI secretion system-associated protein TagF [Paracoccaceae bacterium]